MARKKEEPNYIEELAERFDRWDDVYQNGCHDPFWSDGVNLNLIRNHILYYNLNTGAPAAIGGGFHFRISAEVLISR